jgi:hypothetical protein
MTVSTRKRFEYWNHFIAQWVLYPGKRYPSVTKTRLRKIMPQIMEDDDFWWDIVLRHGGDRMTPEEMATLDPQTYEHCLGNFWGGIHQDMMDAGLI